MRVLLTTWAWRSHYYPLVPFCWALRAAGHEVRVASQPSMVATIAESGVPAVGLGADLDFRQTVDEQIGAKGMAADHGAPDPADLRQSGRMARVLRALGVAVRYAEAIIDDLVEFGREWRPDLIVYEPINLAAPLAAKVLGVPAVRHLWGPDFAHQINELEPELMGTLKERFGVDTVNLLGDLTVDPCPSSLQVPADVPRQLMRFVPYNGPAETPEWLRRLPDRPRICVTWGTLIAGLDMDQLFHAPRIVNALSDVDAEVVVTVAPSQLRHFRDVPDNVRLLDEPVALHLLLPHCQAVVHQGGAGTLMTALSFGLPQLIIPHIPDQIFNARRLRDAGAGHLLMPAEATSEAIQDRVVELLAGAPHGTRARELRDELMSQPTPADVVKAIDGSFFTPPPAQRFRATPEAAGQGRSQHRP